jgi:hypothetical protein
VRPAGPGWARIRELAGPGVPASDQLVTSDVIEALRLDARAEGDNIPLALLGWFAGSTAIWSALFAEGNYLYGRMPQAIFLTGVFIVSTAVLIAVIRRTWASR